MKKTLITLAALAMASVASATTAADALVNTTTITTRGEGKSYGVNAPSNSDSYTWIAVLDWDDAITDKGLSDWNNKSRIYATDGTNAPAAVGAVFFRNNTDEIAIQFAEHEKGSVYSGLDGSSYTNDGFTLFLDT